MSFLACTIAYSDRVNISVAAVAMKEQLGWSQTQKGLVLSAFFVGYMLFMFASGVLATRFGGKRVLGLAVLAWSVLTLLTPPAAALSLTALIAARIGMGIGEAAMFPASYELFGRWVPPIERARATGRLMSGISLGTVLGLMATGWIVGHFGWPMAFYSFGVVGLLWVAVWFPLVHNDPAADPRVSPQERALLQHARPSTGATGPVPWRRLLLRPSSLAFMIAHFCTTWCLYVLLSWLPSYFREVQGLSIVNAGLFSAAPWLTMFIVTLAAGSISDRMIGRGVSVTTTRKLMQCSGLIGSAVFLVATRNVHSATVALVLLCGAMGALGFAWSGYAPNALDLAPKYAALLFGLSNTIATVPGIVGVTATGWLVDVTGTYSAPFALTASISVVGAVVYALFFNARPLLD